jgi:L,D-peptidoglycan transpeptidase YkuD (ErfK/YbiS/YcfS/YnhG family)
LKAVRVVALSRAATLGTTRGVVLAGSLQLPCAIGRSGMRALKREGDGASPLGQWKARRLLYRADHGVRPRTGLALQALRRTDGWCDAPGDANYNRPVRHPYSASAERMWRDDPLYDRVVVLGHNDRPRVRGGGSAIFIHLARAGYTPTEGCVALARRDLALLLSWMGPHTRVVIG